MRRLKTFILDEALTFFQRCHQKPEQLATAALLKFQRELDLLDKRLTTDEVVQTAAQLSVRIDELVATLAPYAAAAGLEGLPLNAVVTHLLVAQAQTPADVTETQELLTQLRVDFHLQEDATLDMLYAEIDKMRTAATGEPLKGRRKAAAARI